MKADTLDYLTNTFLKEISKRQKLSATQMLKIGGAIKKIIRKYIYDLLP